VLGPAAAMLAALVAPRPASAALTDTASRRSVRRPKRKKEWARAGARERARKHHQVRAGRTAERRRFFDFGKPNETDAAFTRTAVAMEDLTWRCWPA
jgi:hypothetical protein